MPNVQDGSEWRSNRVRAREQAERNRALIAGEQPDETEDDDAEDDD